MNYDDSEDGYDPIDSGEVDFATLQDELQSSLDLLQEAKKENQDLKKITEMLRQLINELTDENETFEEKLVELRSALEALVSEQETFEETNQILSSQKESLDDEINALKASNDVLQEQNSYLSDQIEAIRYDKDLFKGDCANLQQIVNEKNQQILNLEAKVQNSKEAFAEANALRQSFQVLEGESKTLKALLADQNHQRNLDQYQVEVLKSELDALRRTKVEAAEEGRVAKNIIAVVFSLVVLTGGGYLSWMGATRLWNHFHHNNNTTTVKEMK